MWWIYQKIHAIIIYNLLNGVILTKVISGVNFNQNLYLVIIYFGKVI